jgi:tRNA wybutosine-synthesizing protein 3
MKAALNAGFRESGIRNITTRPQQDGPMPHVAVRGMGLGLDSVIGYVDDHGEVEHEAKLVIRSMVDEAYLRALVSITNTKFEENSRRTEAFRLELLKLCSREHTIGPEPNARQWEDAAARRERKRREGLQKRFEQQRNQSSPIEASSLGTLGVYQECVDSSNSKIP